MNVSLISVSPDAEKHMAYCARVSNPNNQENENYACLLYTSPSPRDTEVSRMPSSA